MLRLIKRLVRDSHIEGYVMEDEETGETKVFDRNMKHIQDDYDEELEADE